MRIVLTRKDHAHSRYDQHWENYDIIHSLSAPTTVHGLHGPAALKRLCRALAVRLVLLPVVVRLAAQLLDSVGAVLLALLTGIWRDVRQRLKKKSFLQRQVVVRDEKGRGERLTRVGKVCLVTLDLVGDVLLALGELLHVSRHGGLGAGRFHN